MLLMSSNLNCLIWNASNVLLISKIESAVIQFWMFFNENNNYLIIFKFITKQFWTKIINLEPKN